MCKQNKGEIHNENKNNYKKDSSSNCYSSNSIWGYWSVTAWFNSGYKTTAADTKYGVKKNAYIKQCWVRIQEGSYDKKVWSEAFTRAEKKQGRASLTCGNNPFYVATATWGWKYN